MKNFPHEVRARGPHPQKTRYSANLEAKNGPRPKGRSQRMLTGRVLGWDQKENMMLLENTHDKFQAMCSKWGTADPEAFERQLRSLISRVQMDSRNMISRGFADMEQETMKLAASTSIIKIVRPAVIEQAASLSDAALKCLDNRLTGAEAVIALDAMKEFAAMRTAELEKRDRTCPHCGDQCDLIGD